jgi:diamine N-acetyltransferase
MKIMATDVPQKAFGNSTEDLNDCQLSLTLTNEQAGAVAEMLSGSEPWRSLNFSASSLANYLTREDAALRRYAIIVENRVAGVICVRSPWLRGPYIELLGLSPDCRGRGIGRRVLAWAETEARRESGNLWVLTSSFNHQALGFYQSLGFRQVGTIPGLVTPEYDEIILRKILR